MDKPIENPEQNRYLLWLAPCYAIAGINHLIRTGVWPHYDNFGLEFILIVLFLCFAGSFVYNSQKNRQWSWILLLPAVALYGLPFGAIGMFIGVSIHGF